MASRLYMLSKVELSFAYLFLSLAYVAVFAYFMFREELNAFRIAGIGFISIGTALIVQSGPSHTETTATTTTPETVKTSELAR
ncbi:hypothetical protein GCM10007857_44850 [Bradyrhizobium iriomotense]|uniref:EamA domain-containing protein n=1 Tax=Bradyrhizobium iriomotense TaxID=441950 RepID=A0ABQ6B011_9BRAD|nr:hypothetical protein GCM10007857_44850 [Bradyrhizobium iriomotense]